MAEVPAVYGAISAVMADLAKEGVGKHQRNQQQGYAFRGIDDIYNALAPALARHGLCILPRVLTRTVGERETKSGVALFSVVVEVEFDLVAAADGSKHTVRTIGEAMDSGDKATNKAMSAAFKYAVIEAFCLPTEGDNDADATTHEVKAGDLKERGLALLRSAENLDQLKALWSSMPAEMRALVNGEKERIKKELAHAAGN